MFTNMKYSQAAQINLVNILTSNALFANLNFVLVKSILDNTHYY